MFLWVIIADLPSCQSLFVRFARVPKRLCACQLIILEFAGLLNPVSTALAWRACLGLMVVSLHWVLPFLLAFACLGEMGLGR